MPERQRARNGISGRSRGARPAVERVAAGVSSATEFAAAGIDVNGLTMDGVE
jgi:hypothetical protein